MVEWGLERMERVDWEEGRMSTKMIRTTENPLQTQVLLVVRSHHHGEGPK